MTQPTFLLSVTRYLLILSCGAFLSGCVSLLPKATNPPQEFTLGSLDKSLGSSTQKKQTVIKIAKTIAAAPLQAQQILILSEKGDLLESHYLADAIWHEPLADLVQCRLVEELRLRQSFKGIGHGHESFRPDLLYLPAIHHFEIVKSESGQHKTRVILSVREVVYQDRTLRREKVFRDERPVPPELRGFVAGLNQSFLKVLADIISWID